MGINLREESLKGIKPQSGGREKSDPTQVAQSPTVIVQQLLLSKGLPISTKPVSVPDGGWGPKSNESLGKLIDQLTQAGYFVQEGAPKYQISSLYNAQDPAATAANLPKIIEALGIGAREKEQQAPGQKPETQKYQYFFDAELNGKHFRVPLSREALASPAAFEAVLEGVGMIKMDSAGKARAAEIDAAARAVWESLDEEKYVAAKDKILGLRNQLVATYSKDGGASKDAAQYLREINADQLAGRSEPVVQSVIANIMSWLRTNRIISEDNKIFDESLIRGHSSAIRERITQLLGERSK
jgi:hypothetical protein